MSSPSSNNVEEDAWLLKIELRREEPKEATNEDKAKEVAGDQAQEGEKAMLMGVVEKEEDILQPYYNHLTPTKIEAFKAFEIICVQNTYLTREIILLEEENIALRGINRRLEYL